MPIDFNVNPYNDDFQEDNGPRENNYMRILFKPGYAVQARELTQLQTAIQNQIKMFGDHIFTDGSQVSGGHLTYDNTVVSLKVENQFGAVDVDLSDFNNQLITNNSGVDNKKARVIAVDDSQEFKTLMVRYIRGKPFTDGETIKVVPGDNPKATLRAVESANVGSVISINEGVFYVDGFFVYVPQQTIVLDPYSNTPTYRVGLEIDESIIDESADSTLLDPAQESFNYQAPGADRYQYNLVLAKRTLDSIDDSSFFELLRVENGVITKQVKYPVYSEIEKTLARRTYDESGNYTVYPFRASTADHPTNDNKFIINIEPGKAYVKGFEFETIGKTPITLNKARTIEVIEGYDLSLEFGNYVTVKNLYSGSDGIFNTAEFESLDLHIVPTANIATTSFEEYNRTLIGTVRAKALQRNSGSKFDLYVLDQNMTSNTFNVASATTNTIEFPSDYPIGPTGVYNGVSFTVTSGPGAGQTRRIVSYNGSRIATLDRPFDSVFGALNNTSYVTLNYAFKDTESIVVRPTSYSAQVYGGQNPSNAIYPSMDIDEFSSKSSTGDTFLSRSKEDKLLFTFPETAISSNFSNIDYYHRKLLTNRVFGENGGGTYTINLDSPEKYFYGSEVNFLSNAQVDEHIIVIVKDKQNSSYSNGEILSLYWDGVPRQITAPYGGNGAFRKSETSIELRVPGGESFVADVFINVKVDNATSPTRKTKTLRGNKSSIASFGIGTATQTVTGQTGTKIDTENGIVWITNYNDVIKTPGIKQSLFISDVIKINKIYDSGDPKFVPNSINAIDITENYLFDTGQRDNYYDHGSIILRTGKSAPKGQTAIFLTYFAHGSDQGFFNRDSYSEEAISNNFVAIYSSSTVPSISLLDTMDFRPRRVDYTTATTFSGLKIPYTELSMELDYGYYLPRIDKLIVTSAKEFKVIPGIPSKYPKVPADVPDSMTIYTVYIPPYTKKAKDVKLGFHENRRYTMKDIALIDKRMQRLEYYTQLSLLEQQAKNETYFYENRSIEKEKYGILVDQFDGFNIADNKNPDLLCHISFNELKPYKKITPIELELIGSTGSYKLNSKTYSLNYSEKEFISQNTATKATTVQPYMFGTFNGTIELRPEIDYWVSENLLAERTDATSATSEPPPGGTAAANEEAAATETGSTTQATASDAAAQATSATTTTHTGETITENGYESTAFDQLTERSETAAATLTAVSTSTSALANELDLSTILDLAAAAAAAASQYTHFTSPLSGTSGPFITYNARTVGSLKKN